MTIVIIDDNSHKCRKIEEALKAKRINFVTFHELKSAIEFLEINKIDGIITDFDYPFDSNLTIPKEKSGNLLLQWLTSKKKEIPVLGNSFCKFKEIYPYYKGRMPGFFHEGIFEAFISSIKDHY